MSAIPGVLAFFVGVALLYPEGLTQDTQAMLGAIVVVINAAIYIVVLRRRRASP